jgi:glycosyltransferase involved in cell wall biosynthesis
MSRRIKILFTIPNFDTAGSGKVVYDLVNQLDKNKFQAEICCFHNKGAFFKEIEQLGVPIHLVKFTADYKPFISLPSRIHRIYKFFKTHKFDVIHSWHWSSDFTEALAAKLAGIPYVYTKKAMGWGNKSWLWRSKLSTKIIAINKAMMTRFFDSMTNKTILLPLGVNATYFQPLEKKLKTPEGLVFKNEDIVIVTVANLVPVKGIEVLLKAVKVTANNNLHVLVVGDKKTAYGQQLVNDFTSNNVHFIGKKIDVRPYLSVADIFVIPTHSKGEGMPIAAMEAMASQRIVIGSNVSGIQDILLPFPQCLFEPNDVDSLANTLKMILSLSTEEKMILIKAMRCYIEEELSIDKFIKSYEEVYLNLV